MGYRFAKELSLRLAVFSILLGASAAHVRASSVKLQKEERRKKATHSGWFDRVTRTQGEQPHWITPLVTVTPRLEEEVRFDINHQRQPNGSTTNSFGGGKGLELIPAEHMEIILGVPAYLEHAPAGGHNGISDTSFLLKYRVLSANEQKGNYILTFFFGATAPTALKGNGTSHATFTPTVAFGKGLGQFDVQTTLGVAVPSGARDQLGTPVLHNVAFQYRAFKKLWPEMEVNSTWWPNGLRAGKKQVFLTPGLVVGRLPLWRRMGLTVGAGMQIAVTEYHTYNHGLILSFRLPF